MCGVQRNWGFDARLKKVNYTVVGNLNRLQGGESNSRGFLWDYVLLQTFSHFQLKET